MPLGLRVVPEEVEEVNVPLAEVAIADGKDIRLDRLLVRCGLADSVTDAARKIKQSSVLVGGVVRTHHSYRLENEPPVRLSIRVGKRIKIAAIH